MVNIDLSKVQPAERRRGEVIDWPGSESARQREAHDERAAQRLFAHAVAPWLTPDARVVEIGPGAGKWTVHIAPLVSELVVVDESETMLQRTHTRVQGAGFRNVSFVLGNGRGLGPLPSEHFDVVFSCDVFTGISIEDTLAHLAEIARVLRDGGLAVLHHAVHDERSALDRMYGRFGLRIESVWSDASSTVVSARRPTDSVVPKLEQALRSAASADDEAAVDRAIADLQAVGRDLTDRLEPLAAALAVVAPGPERIDLIQKIRRLVRG